MATLFSLNDGNLTDTNVFGQTISSADYFSGVADLSVTTSYGVSSINNISIISDGNSISAIAVNVNHRSSNPVGTLSMLLSSAASAVTETYAISSFTSYDSSNNLIPSVSQNWQILKLTAPFSSTFGNTIRLDFKTSNSDQLVLIGSSGNVNKVLVTTTTKDITNLLEYRSLTKVNSPTLSSASPFGVGTDSSIYFPSTSRVELANSPDFGFGTDDFTIECWVYRVGSTAYDAIFEIGQYPGVGLLLRTNSTGDHIWINGVNGGNWYNDTILPKNQWRHIAVCRYNNTLNVYINGTSSFNLDVTGIDLGSSQTLYIGNSKYSASTQGFEGYISNFRIVKGSSIYTSNFSSSVPTAPLDPVKTTSLLYKDPYSTSYIFETPGNLHIGGALKGLTSENRVLTASTVEVGDLYVHAQSKLVFPSDTSKTLTINGSKGLQITSDGTLEIGTANSPIASTIQHNIILNNSQVDVHNGGNMNVYGAYKKPYTYLTSDSLSSTKSFTVVDSVSTSWLSGDSVVFTPNTYQRTSFDVLTLSSFDSGTTFKTTTSAVYNHPSVTSLGNVPTVSNLSRNITIQGESSSKRAAVRAVDAAKVNIANTQFTNFGIAATNKTGFVVGTNSSGYVSLSGNAFYSDGFSGTAHIATVSGKSVLGNLSLKDNVFFKSGGYGVSLSSVSATGLTVTGNTVLSANNSGLYFASVSSSGATMANNTVIGSKSYGTFITNCTIDGDFGGAINYGNANRGLVLSADHIGNLSNLISMYNTNEGIYIDGAMAGLSSTIFSGITSNNNTSTGIQVSGNNVNASSPIVLNMSNVVAKNNDGIGFEMYNISGNISSVYLDNNLNYGMKTSLGGETTIDGLSSFMTATSVSDTLIKNGTSLSAGSPFGVGTDSSIRFNGTADYIYKTGNGIVNFGSSDFTVESWVFLNAMPTSDAWPTNFSLHMVLIECGTPSAADGCAFVIGQTKLIFVSNDVQYATVTHNMVSNRWYHIAYTRSGNVIYVFVNGVLKGTGSITGSVGTGSNTYIGCETNQGAFFNGYMSNLRVIQNTALYTSDFAVPTTPLTLKPRTSLLFQDPYNTSYNYVAYRGVDAINLGLIGGNSYYPINIKNSNISSAGGSYYGTPLLLDSTNYKQFNVENTTLSSNSDAITLKSTTDKVRGSYMFNNCKVGSSAVLGNSNYQSDVFKTTGVAFMNKNNVDSSNSTHFAAGERSLDTAIFINAESSPSEKLKPVSTSLKLRSGSKFVALNSGESVIINVYVRKSTLGTDGAAYNGNSPRLMLKRNATMGISQDIVMDQLDTTSELFLKLSAQTPTVTNNGVLEFYVDCDGTQGFINVDNWAAI